MIPFNQWNAMKRIFITCFASFIIVIISCKKDDGINSDNASKRTLLINKKWQIQSNISIDSMNRETDLFTGLEAYQKDDYTLYNADSTYEINDNFILQSDSISKIIDSGTWLLSDDNSTLLRHSDMFQHDYEPVVIKQLSSTALITESYFPSDHSTIRTSYVSVP